jgi:hypothetical protein
MAVELEKRRPRRASAGPAGNQQALQQIRAALAEGDIARARDLCAIAAEAYPGDETIRKLVLALAPPKLLRTDLPPSPEISKNHGWLREHWDEYRGNWVALRDGELIGKAKDFRALRQVPGCDKDVFYAKIA